jgi:allantoinase
VTEPEPGQPDLTVLARRIVRAGGEQAGAVLVRDGQIVDVVDESAAPRRSATGRVLHVPDDCVLLPGLVDSHVHVNEPGRTAWEGFASATAAAAAGGITTIVDMPLNSIPPTVDVAALNAKRTAAQTVSAVDVAFWGGAVPGNLDDLEPLHEAGVVGFKCFLLDSGVEEFPPLDDAELRAAMERIASFDGLLVAHAEDAGYIEADGVGTTYRSFLDSRPPRAETAALDRLVKAVRDTGCRTHVVHVSAAESVPRVAAAKAEGLPVTAETCPHYLTLTADEIPDGATQFKCCPPIRDSANREQLWAALLDGVVDCVVSDHSPCTVDLKHLDVGDFAAAWGGIASVQLSLPVMWTAAAARGLPLSRLATWMGSRPAELTGLPGRGAIEPGHRADLVVFAPDETFVVDPAQLLHRNPVSAYAGRTLRGVVRSTLLGGVPVEAGRPRGRLVARGARAETSR